MLSVSGELTTHMGRQSWPDGLANDFEYVHDEPCRSIYLPLFRNSLPSLLVEFDFANPSVGMGQRPRTISPQQSLFLMNDPWVAARARAAARRLLQETPARPRALLDAAALRCYARALTDAEHQILDATLNSTDNADWESELAHVVHVMFASLEFRYEN